MAGPFASEVKHDERRPMSSDDAEETQFQRIHCLDAKTTSAVLPVAAYCLASILMTVINKFIVSGTGFSMNLLLLCTQSTVCVLCVLAAKSCGLMSVRDLNLSDAKRWFPVSLSIVAVVYTGSKSLQFFNIAVYSIFKNFTLILIAYGEKFTTGAQVPRLALVSFLLMILSSVIAATSDTRLPPAQVAFGHSFNIGYVWMLLNCIATAANSLMLRGRMKSMGFKDGDTTFYNNLLAIPVLIGASLLIEDWSPANLARNFPEDTRNVLLFAVVVSGGALAFISYTIAWCLRATSSTTCSMAGALNKLPVAVSGMVFFGDPVTVGSVSAIGTGFVAGLLYIEAKRRAPPPAESLDEREAVLPLHHEKPSQ